MKRYRVGKQSSGSWATHPRSLQLLFFGNHPSKSIFAKGLVFWHLTVIDVHISHFPQAVSNTTASRIANEILH